MKNIYLVIYDDLKIDLKLLKVTAAMYFFSSLSCDKLANKKNIDKLSNVVALSKTVY